MIGLIIEKVYQRNFRCEIFLSKKFKLDLKCFLGSVRSWQYILNQVMTKYHLTGPKIVYIGNTESLNMYGQYPQNKRKQVSGVRCQMSGVIVIESNKNLFLNNIHYILQHFLNNIATYRLIQPLGRFSEKYPNIFGGQRMDK